jgi:hypothetical protein
MFIDRAPADFDFMAAHRNHLDGGLLAGDFQFGFDIFLWDRTLVELEADLLALSAQGMTIAIPDDTSASPFAMILFHRGKRLLAEVLEDEVTEETYIHVPKGIRKELPGHLAT